MNPTASNLPNSCRRTWTEIDLDALVENTNQILRLLPPKQQLIATVKANAYGHGDCVIAKTLMQNGVHFFAVSNIDEAITLRLGGITGEILILGYTPPQQTNLLLQYRILQTIYSLEMAKAFSEEAGALGQTLRVHLKLDTGMGRIGFLYDDPQLMQKLIQTAALPHLCAEGVFTHLSSADMSDAESNAYTQTQLDRFSRIVRTLRKNGVAVSIAHIQNSAGILRRLSGDFEASRAGIILYGVYPSDETIRSAPLKPVMSWKAVISHIKTVPAGHSISYARRFTSTRPVSTVATVPIGYADGYPRAISGKGYCLVHGSQCPILGNICMDQLMLDVTGLPDVSCGDTVTLMGTDGTERISAEQLAAWSGTIPYEILCHPSRRVARVYLWNGRISAAENDAMTCAQSRCNFGQEI